jgi:hypothetical protein
MYLFILVIKTVLRAGAGFGRNTLLDLEFLYAIWAYKMLQIKKFKVRFERQIHKYLPKNLFGVYLQCVFKKHAIFMDHGKFCFPGNGAEEEPEPHKKLD